MFTPLLQEPRHLYDFSFYFAADFVQLFPELGGLILERGAFIDIAGNILPHQNRAAAAGQLYGFQAIRHASF